MIRDCGTCENEHDTTACEPCLSCHRTIEFVSWTPKKINPRHRAEPELTFPEIVPSMLDKEPPCG